MMWADHGVWQWGGGALMMIAMVAAWGLVAWAVVALIRHSTRGGEDGTPTHPDAWEILRQRFARGAIDEDEYERRLAALGDAPGGRVSARRTPRS